jgi:hypothetical protein
VSVSAPGLVSVSAPGLVSVPVSVSVAVIVTITVLVPVPSSQMMVSYFCTCCHHGHRCRCSHYSPATTLIGSLRSISRAWLSRLHDAPYRSGPSKARVKSKNPASEAVRREREEEWR